LFACVTGIALALPGQAMEKTDDIDTNRPSFMDSPLVLPKSSIQLENGTLFQGFHGHQWIYDVPETEVRVGLSKRTELQFFTPNYNLVHTTGSPTSQVSDLSEIGIKQQLGPLFADSKTLPGWCKNYNLAMIVGVTPPTGSSQVSGSGTEGTVRFPWSKAVGKNYCIAGMQSLLLINSGRNVQYQPDVLFGRNIGPRGFIFSEYGGFFTNNFPSLNIAHFGGVYKMTRHQQVDIQFGFGMNHAAPIAFVGAGYSFRFDKFSW